MSYALSAALQSAVYQALVNDAALTTALDGHVYDAVPDGPLPPLYATLGSETVEDASDADTRGARHDFTVSVVTELSGFQQAKEAAAAISDVLDGASLTLARGRLIGLWFRRAKAARETDGLRRIDLIFRARVEDA